MGDRQEGRRAVPLVGIYVALLVGCSSYVLLDAFVIERSYAKVTPVEATATTQGDETTGSGVAEEGSDAVGADGATGESAGLSLQQLATYLVDELGAECAYNLDGGGSSTLYYDGAVVNNPTSGGSIKERSVSDIVYLAS